RGLASAGTEQADRLVASEKIEQILEMRPTLAVECRLFLQNQSGIVARGFQKLGLCTCIRNAEARRAGLAGAKNFALSAQSQIFLGNQETVVGFAHDRQARAGGFADRRLVEQQAGRGFLPASDPAAQLMQLRQAEPL